MSTMSTSVAVLSPSLATPALSPGRGAKAAREFEAHLLGSMLESMEKTFATLPGEDMPGAVTRTLSAPRPCPKLWRRKAVSVSRL